jgi:hypothetical protein
MSFSQELLDGVLEGKNVTWKKDFHRILMPLSHDTGLQQVLSL